MQPTDTIKALDRALDILDTLRAHGKPLGVNELAKLCDINLSTAFRTLKTLESRGWVFQCQDTKYILGEKISFVTEKDNLYLALKEVAQLVMQRHTAQEGQAMNLLVRDGTSCMVLQQSRTDRILDFVPPIGAQLPLYASAGGKVLLSELPAFLVEDILSAVEFKRLSKNTVASKFDLMGQLEGVRQKGYAVDLNESSDFASCISVPVRSREGEIIAALSFSGVINAASEQELLYYLPSLQQAAEQIAQRLYKRMDA